MSDLPEQQQSSPPPAAPAEPASPAPTCDTSEERSPLPSAPLNTSDTSQGSSTRPSSPAAPDETPPASTPDDEAASTSTPATEKTTLSDSSNSILNYSQASSSLLSQASITTRDRQALATVEEAERRQEDYQSRYPGAYRRFKEFSDYIPDWEWELTVKMGDAPRPFHLTLCMIYCKTNHELIEATRAFKTLSNTQKKKKKRDVRLLAAKLFWLAIQLLSYNAGDNNDNLYTIPWGQLVSLFKD